MEYSLPMTESVRRRFEEAEHARLTWDPEQGGREGPVCFRDDKLVDLGPDSSKKLFYAIATRMMSGQYYPPDAVRFHGRFRDEKRKLAQGDRVLQQAPLFGKLGILYAWSMVELFVAEQAEDSCRIGYVTTARHHGRGIWSAELRWEAGKLTLRVKSIACPQSWLFWMGLPVARYLQLRARGRAIQEFKRLRLIHEA